MATTISRSQYYRTFAVRLGATRNRNIRCHVKELEQVVMEEWLKIPLDQVDQEGL